MAKVGRCGPGKRSRVADEVAVAQLRSVGPGIPQRLSLSRVALIFRHTTEVFLQLVAVAVADSLVGRVFKAFYAAAICGKL